MAKDFVLNEQQRFCKDSVYTFLMRGHDPIHHATVQA